MSEDAIAAWLGDLELRSPEQHATIVEVDRLFTTMNVQITRQIKYGGIVVMLGEVLVGGLFAYRDHVSVEFSNGAQLSDPHRVLAGSGKYRRHIKLAHPTDVTHKHVADYVRAALDHAVATG